ncbi:dTDP-4-dehydrorhamnose reductase [Acuticoccus sediminis]|uniref:dTDP-4-dehydrorhamnose reductase n=1 Tax=Acuticoccus sediminis TaxID=2184697 RepID=A0A8B2NHV8_9HYPH|nr:dTDP-4-dehydrorhamnose reductase [Acuticoccus sediminis]RAH96517.1 dTDP-4-dehydrorhamnose reductase [Acuticoccus sediminis]
MKVLVIGHSGQVARALVERADGDTVTALGRPEIDLAAPDTLARAFDAATPDVVVNAAAYTAVDAAESDEDAARALNATGPGRLAERCAADGVPLIHISTDYVFDGTLDRPYREDDPIAPQSAYGRTKAEGEAAVRAAGGRTLVARTAWVYSPFGKNFVKTMLRVGAERDTLTVVADQHGNPTSALDIADALLALARQSAAWPDGGEIVHVAGRGDTTWCDFARAIVASLPEPPTVKAITTADYPTPATRPANSRLDGTRLAERYGIAMPHWTQSLDVVLARLAGSPEG